jgi:hypothetical protein
VRRALLSLPAVAALALPLVAGGAPNRRATLRVTVSGDGAVVVGTRACRSRCTWHFPAGTRVRLQAQAAMGYQFVRWRGKCSSHGSVCAIRLKRGGALAARFTPITTLTSWSTHVSCTPVRTTIPEILGTQENPDHGATEAGGRFQPHLRGGLQQHLLNPPCEVGGTPAFVEVDDVVVTNMHGRGADGDDSVNLTQVDRPDITNPYMKTLHAEIDGTWIVAKVAPPFWPDEVGTRIDVQGFVFWDPAHLDDAWHQYSGWELHPVAAWRHAAAAKT